MFALRYCRNLCLLATLLAIHVSIKAQNDSLILLHSTPLRATPTAVSVDKQGILYIADTQNVLTQYDTAGRALLQFSMPQTMTSARLVEAWQTLRIAIFYLDTQEIILLDRFLNIKHTHNFSQSTLIGFAPMATLAPNSDYWVFDNTDFHLKRLDAQNRELSLYVSLNFLVANGRSQITFMREYQNLLFLADEFSGIWVLDNLANYKYTIPYRDISFIGVYGNEIYFLQNNTLIFWHLYQKKERKIVLPKPKNTQKYKFTIIIAEKYACITDTLIDFYTIKKP